MGSGWLLSIQLLVVEKMCVFIPAGWDNFNISSDGHSFCKHELHGLILVADVLPKVESYGVEGLGTFLKLEDRRLFLNLRFLVLVESRYLFEFLADRDCRVPFLKIVCFSFVGVGSTNPFD